MAATKYQVLYRYSNPNSNQFITNDTDTNYKQTFELYHQEHKIQIGTDEEKLEANDEKSNLIVEGNSTANDNYNMLFKFTGTKQFNKQVWMPPSIGYVIRDKYAVKDLVTRAVDGDFSGDYLLFEGDSIENGIVVARENPVPNTGIGIRQTDAANRIYFADEDELMNVITNSTIASLSSDIVSDYGTLNSFTATNGNREVTNEGVCNINIKVGSDFEISDRIDYYVGGSDKKLAKKALWNSAYSLVTDSGSQGFTTITVKPAHVETYEIPAHYEGVAGYPYAVYDTYERINQSPWFILSTHASLQSALEKARTVVKSVGIENVKLIKVVPTDQFVKIN